MISILTPLMSFLSQQQQVSNSSAHNTPHSGVGAAANMGDNTPPNVVAPANQMTVLINGGVGILPQSENTSVKVAPGSRTSDHGHVGKGGGFIPPHGDNTPSKGVSPSMSGRIRGGCRGLPLLPMQHPEIAHINF